MNYDKWSKIDGENEEDESPEEIDSELNRLKNNADRLFEANETNAGAMTVSYKDCISLYLRVIKLTEGLAEHKELCIRCHLNLACCFIRESEWVLAMQHGQQADCLCSAEDWNQKLRAKYFEIYALCTMVSHMEHAARLAYHTQLSEAERDVKTMTQALELHASFISEEHLGDYEEVFRQLRGVIARVDRDIESTAESHFEKALQHQRNRSDIKVTPFMYMLLINHTKESLFLVIIQ